MSKLRNNNKHLSIEEQKLKMRARWVDGLTGRGALEHIHMPLHSTEHNVY